MENNKETYDEGGKSDKEIKKIDFGTRAYAEKNADILSPEELKEEYVKEKIQATEFRQAYIGIIQHIKMWNLRLKETTDVEIKLDGIIYDHNFSHLPFFEGQKL